MHKSNVNRLEAFRNMYVDEEEPHQNGDLDHEVCKCNSLYLISDPENIIFSKMFCSRIKLSL